MCGHLIYVRMNRIMEWKNVHIIICLRLFLFHDRTPFIFDSQSSETVCNLFTGAIYIFSFHKFVKERH